MVTLAEFVRHVVIGALVMGVGLGAVAYTRFRFDTAHRTFRRFALWYVGLVALTAVLSAMSSVQTKRCPRDPTEFCRFNDSVPAMATIAFIYAVLGLYKARSCYNRR